jgi:hypothetical protein
LRRHDAAAAETMAEREAEVSLRFTPGFTLIIVFTFHCKFNVLLLELIALAEISLLS